MTTDWPAFQVLPWKFYRSRDQCRRIFLLRVFNDWMQIMRILGCLLIVLSYVETAWAQPEADHNVLNAEEKAQGKVLLFDGKTTSGWIIDGDAEVKDGVRSEEHTSELQSQSNLVCRLLLEQ